MARRVMMVTGGSRGIGAATAVLAAQRGYDLLLTYRSEVARAEATARACEAAGARVILMQGDAGSESDILAAFNRIDEAFGRIDVLVCNAGITRDGLIMRLSEADFDAVVDTNLKGTFLCMKAVSKIMMKQRYGRIVTLSSVVGLRGNAGQTNYAASKAGIVGLTKSMAKELASRGITANAVAPGFIETDMTAALTDAQKKEAARDIPAGRLGQPEDVAEAVAFLADEKAAYITGHVLCVDGGMAV